MCRIGQAIVYAYGNDVRDVNFGQLQELERLTWDELAMATLRADDETDEVWITCLDVLVAQKVEMIWAMSEAFWEGKHKPWINQDKLR